MKKLLVAGIAAAALSSVPALAAPPSPFNWSGFYVGGNVGYSWGHTSIDYSQSGAGAGGYGTGQCTAACSLPFKVDPNSFVGGLQLGYNFQGGMWVWGVVADLQGPKLSDSTNFTFSGFFDRLGLKEDRDYFGTVRGRLGLTPTSANNWLFYATGGLAYGGFKHTVFQFFNAGVASISQTTTDSQTEIGWTVGGGAEIALPQNWSLGAEYLYMDFGSDTVNALTPHTHGASSTTFRDTSQVVHVTLNYKFGN